jgi:hypothetical protein
VSALGAFTYAPSRNTDDGSRVDTALSEPFWLSLVASGTGRSPLATLHFGDADWEFARLLVDQRGLNADDDELDDEDFEEEDLDEEDDFLEDDFEDEDFDEEDLEEDDFDDLEDEEFEEDDLEDER